MPFWDKLVFCIFQTLGWHLMSSADTFYVFCLFCFGFFYVEVIGGQPANSGLSVWLACFPCACVGFVRRCECVPHLCPKRPLSNPECGKSGDRKWNSVISFWIRKCHYCKIDIIKFTYNMPADSHTFSYHHLLKLKHSWRYTICCARTTREST